MRLVEVGPHRLGPSQPCFVIAEAGVNHNGSLDVARQLIDAACDAGADAVKFQSFRAEGVASKSAPKARYQRVATNTEQSQLQMLQRLQLDEPTHRELMKRCKEKGILFLSTPFDIESLALLVRLGVPAIKLSSGEVTNWPLLRAAAATGLPLILSTGMANLHEVKAAVELIGHAGCEHFVLLHCVTEYPAPATAVNLRAIQTMAHELDCPVGYSDHTLGNCVGLAAVAMGACVIEKHFTLDRSLPGPDHTASALPTELKELVCQIRQIEQALGDGLKRPSRVELENRTIVRRSLAANQPIQAGSVLSWDQLTALRPATGISPDQIQRVIGRTINTDLDAGELIEERHLA